jgi:hypothetical protein
MDVLERAIIGMLALVVDQPSHIICLLGMTVVRLLGAE